MICDSSGPLGSCLGSLCEVRGLPPTGSPGPQEIFKPIISPGCTSLGPWGTPLRARGTDIYYTRENPNQWIAELSIGPPSAPI